MGMKLEQHSTFHRIVFAEIFVASCHPLETRLTTRIHSSSLRRNKKSSRTKLRGNFPSSHTSFPACTHANAPTQSLSGFATKESNFNMIFSPFRSLLLNFTPFFSLTSHSIAMKYCSQEIWKLLFLCFMIHRTNIGLPAMGQTKENSR